MYVDLSKEEVDDLLFCIKFVQENSSYPTEKLEKKLEALYDFPSTEVNYYC